MKITLLPSGIAESGIIPNQYLTTIFVNESVAFDAGALGLYGTPQEQARVRHVFLSHSHIDHWATLPIFLINVFGMGDGPVTLYTSELVLASLQADVFNGRVWPDFLHMTQDGKPFVKVQTIASGTSLEVAGLKVTPVDVEHSVPTQGFLIEEPGAAVVIASDTGPTTEIWRRADQLPNLKAVFLEATLPNSFEALAEVTKHMTAARFVGEMKKLSRPVPFYAVHLSARARDQVLADLLAYGLPNLRIAEAGKAYDF